MLAPSCSSFGGDVGPPDAGPVDLGDANPEVDASDATVDAGFVCATQNRGAAVPLEYVVDQAPAPVGGSLVAGTYVMTRYVAYVLPPSIARVDTDDMHTTTLVIGGGKYTFVDDSVRYGTRSQDQRGGSLAVTPTTVTWNEACSKDWGNEDFTFTATPTTITLRRTSPLGAVPVRPGAYVLWFTKI
ncbi:MAG: hypothetical protein JST00_34645 [Deltaproteobacteria bacterium]|nr:hypothetical protein [Deltaproteobacteria bacterium]